MFDLSNSLVNNDFQINKCTTILRVDERLCYVLPILSIPYFTISSYNRVILSIKFFSCDFVTIKWMDSNRLAPMWQQSGTLLFCSCHGIAGFLVDELQI